MLLDEQLNRRHEYIGGSDMPIIMGASKFKSPWELLLEKTQITTSDFGGNVYSHIGNVLEPKIQEVLGVLNVDEINYSKKYDNVNFECHIDGLTTDEDTIIEIKVANQTLDQCYDSYEWQVRTYMYVTGKTNAKLVLLPRTGILKQMTQYVVKYYDFGNLHDFNNLPSEDVEAAKKDLEYGIEKMQITKYMFKVKHISVCPKKEAQMLRKVSKFWEFKELLDSNNLLRDDKTFKKNFMDFFQ